MTTEKLPWAEGLDEKEQARFLSWALASSFVLPSPFGLGCSAEYELAAFKFWLSIEPETLEHWSDQHPGSRPSCWWAWRSPTPLRQRLGGTGAAQWTDYLSRVTVNDGWQCRHRMARAPEMVAVSKLMPRYGDCWRGLPVAGWGGTVDLNDPPQYESEARFLDRHGLLTEDEAKRLDETDFAPVRLVLQYSENGGLVGVTTEPA